MIKRSSLVEGVGSQKQIEKYYDDWASTYEKTLKDWKYKAPKKSAQILNKHLKTKPKLLLDLACGTGLFAEKILKIYKNCIIDGTDISSKSLKIAKNKQYYRNLYRTSFQKKHKTKDKYNIVSLIGAMTYCNDQLKLFKNVYFFLSNKGYFIFTHRTDLWLKHNFDNFLIKNSKKFKVIYKSRPLDYLPKNNEFKKNIKIRLVLLQKC